jgi:molybdopterin molybdotransferase
MAQLGNDCFAPGQDLMTTAEALAFIDQQISPVAASERVPLAAAAGRILAEDIQARANVPPHDNAAVDGYAFRHADLAGTGKTRLTIVGRAAAGHPWNGPLGPGEAIRIFTGAVMPPDLDTVAMQEDCEARDDTVAIPAGLAVGANRRHAGEDIATDTCILRNGQILRPQDVGLAAAAGEARLPVRAPLKVTVFSTGDEVINPGRTLPPGAIHDSNRFALIALLEGMGCRVRDLGILPDDKATIAAALRTAVDDSDLVVTSGGVSVGEEDHVRGVVEQRGTLHFWRLAIRPGRPLALGQIGDTAFVGIPGNPVAVMVTFLIFVRPIIQRLAGARVTPPQRFPVAAAFSCRKKVGRREWMRARLDGALGHFPAAQRFARDGAGIMTSMVESDGLIELGEDVAEVTQGDIVPFVPYSEVLP